MQKRTIFLLLRNLSPVDAVKLPEAKKMDNRGLTVYFSTGFPVETQKEVANKQKEGKKLEDRHCN